MSEPIHATAVLAGAHGILIRGPSGAGKSALALAMTERGATLVADDRVFLSAVNGRLLATAPAATSGMVELRGRGIVRREHERNVVVSLVVDIVGAESVERMAEESELATEILGIGIPRQPVSAGSEGAVKLIEAALAALSSRRNMNLRPASLW